MKHRLGLLLFLFAFMAVPLRPAASLPEPEPENLSLPDDSESKLISMSFDSAQLKDVLKILSQQSGLNFIASSEVESKKVTVFLENVPVKDALQSIITANGLRYERRKGSSVFVVYPLETTQGGLQTKIFRLKYTRLSISPLDVGGKSTVSDLLSPEEVSALKNSTTQQSAQGGGAAGSGTSQSAKPQALVAERGVDKVVASLLSETGKVTVDLHTNSLIVTDTPGSLAVIEKVLAAIDVPGKQVMIEVYLVEAKKTVLDDLGVDWGGTNGALGSFTGGSRTTAFPFEENFLTKSSPATSSKAAITMGTISATNFTATLRFITSQTDTKILARPRVLTLNNEAANIKLVTSTAVAKTTTTTASEGVTNVTTGQAERTDVGIILKMTPQINEDGYIALFLQPSVTTVAASTFFPSDFLDPTTRAIRTMARVKNHETLVIGGLIDADHSMKNKKVPFLGDLPLVGNAFSYKDRDKTDRELLIFITPHIVEGYDSLGEPSATAPYGEPAIQRTLAYFKNQELKKNLDSAERERKISEPLLESENRLMKSTLGAPAISSAADQEMNRALDSLRRKNTKP